MISESMASNESTLLDKDANAFEWLEITNSIGEAVNLHGWYLTGTQVRPTKGEFPDIDLEDERERIV